MSSPSLPASPAETLAPAAAPSDHSDKVRMTVFVGIFATVLTLSSLLAGLTWRHFTGATSLAWVVVPLVLTLSLVPTILLGFRRRHPLLSVVYKISAVSLGIINYAVFAALACWLVAGVAAATSLALDMRLIAGIGFGGGLLVAGYGLLNAARLQIVEVGVALPNLPASWIGRRIALVSDVHLGNVRGAGFVRRIVARLNALKPDAVLLAGDMFDGAAVDLEVIAQHWDKLSAKHGVYFATGNHDEFSDRQKYLTALSRAGIRVLNNEKVLVDGMQFVGVHDGEAGNAQAYREILRRAEIDPTRASILLTHQPSNLAVPEEAGVGLQVSGHTHGGQFWPWNKVVARVHGRFGYGLNSFGKLQVLTSSGAGTWGPPLRVGTKSEIVMITLTRAE